MHPNRAAFIKSASSRSLEVDDAPFPTPEHDEIVVKNYAVAVVSLLKTNLCLSVA